MRLPWPSRHGGGGCQLESALTAKAGVGLDQAAATGTYAALKLIAVDLAEAGIGPDRSLAS